MKNGWNGKSWLAAAMVGLGMWGEAPAFLGLAEARGEGILSIDPEESIVSPLGGTGSVGIHVAEGARWVAEPMAEWLSIPEGAEGVGEGSVTYRAEAKLSEEARSGQIRFFSPASVPENEGDSGRTIWFETNAVDLATGSRTITPSFPITFDGTAAKTLAGEVLPQRNENDFAVRLHFKIGEQYDISRLLTVFGHSLYVNDVNKLVFEGHIGTTSLGTSSAYWVTVSQDKEKNVRVTLLKEGDSEGTVEIRYEAEEFLHDFTTGTTALGDAFQLGFGTAPSAGYLRNATIYGLEFWERELTDTEAVTMQGGDASAEALPVGGPNEAITAHFRLNQNGCYTVGGDGKVKPATDAGISFTGWRDTIGRLGLPQRALESDGDGRITIPNVNNIFHESYILNNGINLGQSTGQYWLRSSAGSPEYIYYPYPVSCTNHLSGTYNIWLFVDELPASPVTIFERIRISGVETNRIGYTNNYWYSDNAYLGVSLLSSGGLLVNQNGGKQAIEASVIQTGKWCMITFSGIERDSIKIYKDGTEIGAFNTIMSFGYFPPTDARQLSRVDCCYRVVGELIPLVQSFSIGGWDGAIDEVTFYDQALTAEQVKDLYDAGKPRYYYHTVAQEQRAQTVDFPEIGEQWATNEVELAAVASSGLEVAYEVVSGPGALDGTVLSFTGPGTVVIEASQAGDGTWWAAEPVRQEVGVSAVPVEVVLSGLEQVYDGETKAVGVATEPEGVSVRVTYDGAEEPPVHAGDYAVVAETADARYEGRAEGILAVAKAGQGIEFPALGWQVWTNEVELGAEASSGLPVVYAVVSGPGMVSGNVLSFSGPGTVRVSAGQAGNGDWEAAESVEIKVVAGKAAASVVLGDLAQMFDGGVRMVAVETIPAGLAVAVTYDGLEAAPTGAGSYGVVATVVDEVWEGSAEGTLVVAKGAQGIEFAEIGEQVTTNVVELGATASSGLAVEYAVDGPAVLEGGVLSFTGAGVVTVTARQAGDGNWEAAEDVVRSLEVVKASTTVTLGNLEQVFDKGPHAVTVETVPEGVSVVVTYEGSGEAPTEAGSYGVLAVVDDAIWEGSAEGTLLIAKGPQSIEFAGIGGQVATNTVVLAATASSELAVSYAVEGPAVLVGNVLSFTGSGTVTVTASQAGDGNWEAAEAVSVSFEVRKAVAEVSLEGVEQVFDGKTHRVEVATVPEGLSVAVTYDGSGEEPVDAGSYAVVAVVVDDRWEGSATGTLVVAKGTQGIEFAEIGEQVATNVVVLGAVASSGLGVAYTVEGPAEVSGNVLTFTGAGEVTVTASQEGNENWTAAEPVSVSFDVAKAVAEVSLENLEQTFNGEAREAGVSTVPEGLAVAVTYDGSEVAPVNAGEYAVAAVVEDALWEGSAEGTLVIAKGAQSIEFPEIGPQGVTNGVELGATASSGLAVEYAVSGPAVLEGAVLTFTGVGTVTVTAKQEGDGNWDAAADVVRAFEVSKGRATVTLEMLEQEYDGAAKVVEVATVPEGLEVAVTYAVAEAAPVNAGRYAVVATVVDDAWEGSATGMLTVSKGRQSIDFAEIGSCGVAERLDLEAEASSGLAVTFAVLSGPAILEGGASLRFAETGTVTVAAMQFGDDNWLPAETVRQEFAVVKSVAQVSLEGLAQTFDGTEKSVSVETVPEGLAVVVTYDGAEEAPVDAGSYGVSAVVVDGKWEGSAEGVLSIAKGQQVIVFPEVGAQVATNVVELAAEASSGLPVGYEVVSGPGVLEGRYLSFTGVGTVVVQASQEGDSNWEAAEAVSIEIEVGGRLVLTVESAHGVAVPEVGEHEVTIGTVVEAGVSGSPVEIGEGRRAVCTGWRLEGNEPEGGEGTVARFALTNSAVLTWVWETQALIRVEGLAHGTAEGGGWYALGQTATLMAVPEEGHRFTGWEGIVPGGQAGANPVELTVWGPGVAVATFFTTYYAREDGDDAGDGLSWARAKREIASALAEAARGDSVVASNGTYGAVSVPEGVSVRSVEGAEATVIRGGGGVRCVEAAAGAVIEGFSLEGGDVEGDGGGAWLADGAELRRCILHGNKAGGVGGGAYGGTLENCLVSRNAAAQGGGAAGAELRHCTVVRSKGGGAKDCRAVNCVFWENEGGDVEGGATSWSLCNPAAAGAGNIEGDPCFAGEAGWKLAYESPCIDAAADSAVRVDLDGAPRPQPKVYGEELRPDMGCYEYVPKARFVWEKGSGTPPYESWADAARDIQSALDVSGSGDRVVVEAGTYGAVTVSNAVILMGYRGAAETVIDGRGNERAVTMSGGGTLVGFTVRGGASEDCGGILADGGATVRDVVVEGCRATGAEGVGGGLCLYGGSTAENVTASGNAAAYGGGVWAAETSAVVRCELRGNEASAWGGGAWLGDGSRMEGSVIAENSAVRGAGAYGEDCEIDWCEMTGNIAAGAGGGAAVDGGLFRNNRLSGNRASVGGGLYAKDTDGHDCLVTGNEAGRGSGVWMEGAGQLWNFTVADNAGSGAGVAAGGTTVLGNSIAWGNAGGNLDVEGAAEVRYSCVEPVSEGEGNFAEAPAFVGDGDYHLRAGSPCVDAGEVQEWMASAYDLDGQRRVEVGEEGDGRDIWVDIGTDEAANDAVEAPSPSAPWWTWRVVLDARLQLQSTTGLLGAEWENAAEPFTATGQTWQLDEPFSGREKKFYRLIWKKE